MHELPISISKWFFYQLLYLDSFLSGLSVFGLMAAHNVLLHSSDAHTKRNKLRTTLQDKYLCLQNMLTSHNCGSHPGFVTNYSYNLWSPLTRPPAGVDVSREHVGVHASLAHMLTCSNHAVFCIKLLTIKCLSPHRPQQLLSGLLEP